MRFTSTDNHTRSSGFTLVEILIIAPIVILMIGGFVGIMLSMVSEALVTSNQNMMAYSTQSALDTIEQDAFLGTDFLSTSETLPSPQGKNNNFTGTAAFTSGDSLVIRTFATNKNPTDTERQLVYFAKQPNDCGSTQNSNRILLNKVIYFVKDGSLWRRTIVPTWNSNTGSPDVNTVCSQPWQRDTCSPSVVSTNPDKCQSEDTELVQDVADFNVAYYDSPSSTTPLDPTDSDSASTIEVTITTAGQTIGRSVDYSASLRATKFNSSISSDSLEPPAKPNVVSSLIGAQTINFSWPAVLNASSYVVSYRVNGGTWQNAGNNPRATNYTIDAYRLDTVEVRVAAVNLAGASAYDTASRSIPGWTECDLQNGWVNYGTGYMSAGFTKTKTDTVVLKGLIRSGSVGYSAASCILPVGFRPDHKLIFQDTSWPNVAGRVDIDTDGTVYMSIGSSNWMSLDGIVFQAAGSPGSWVGVPLQNGWSNYGAGYAPVQVKKDSENRVYLEGVARAGTWSNNSIPLARLPSGYRPAEYTHHPAFASGYNNMSLQASGDITPGTSANTYIGTQTVYYPAGTTGWSNLSLQNGWSHYTNSTGNTYSTPQYKKGSDGLVIVKGLVTGGNSTLGTVIATLPPSYRPSKEVIIGAVTKGSPYKFARINIYPDGTIRIGSSDTTNSYLSLDSIMFMAEQ